MKTLTLSILLSLLSLAVYADPITLYERSDTHTVNTLNAYQLQEDNTSSSANMQALCGYTEWRSSVYILHADGSTTTLGSDVAIVSRSGVGVGLQTATWDCPETILVSTDAIKIVELMTASGSPTRTFVSEQLNKTKLEASTWTFYKYTGIVVVSVIPERYGATYAWGSSAASSRIENIDLSSGSGSYGFII